jgi:hypothetical protein
MYLSVNKSLKVSNDIMKTKLSLIIFFVLLINALPLNLKIVNAAENWLWPVPNDRAVYSPYNVGNKTLQDIRGGVHRGIDISGSAQYVVASKSGTAITVLNCGCWNPCSHFGGWGNYIVINHKEVDNGAYSLYAHLQPNIEIAKDQWVNQGQIMATRGNTGNSRGRHLHFELYRGGLNRDLHAINSNPTNSNITSSSPSHTAAMIRWGGSINYTIGPTLPVPTDNKPPIPTKPPEQPKNLVVEGRTATVSWDPVATAASYYVYIMKATEGYPVAYGPVNTTNTHLLVPANLEEGSYYAAVIAKNAVGTSPTSEWKLFNVSKPEQPKNVYARPEGRAAAVSWNPVANAASYDVYIMKTTAGYPVVAGPVNTTNSYLLVPANLEAGSYYAAVIAKNAVGNGPASEWKLFNVSTPEQPKNVYARSEGRTAVVSWDPVANATSYDVYIMKTTQGYPIAAGPVNTTNSYLFVPGNLEEGSYYAAVIAKNAVGNGPTSEWKIFSVNGSP